MKQPITIASCQFSVESDLAHNLQAILAQLDEAADRGARVVHFSETALSGYAGVDIPSTGSIDWNQLRAATEQVCQRAAEHNVWVLLGSTHPLGDGAGPHNSVYVINDQGRIVERYDKRFCTGTLDPEPNLDLEHYSPGNHSTVFDVDGYRCGLLICYDYRFPELYRDLGRQGVELLFQSFHNARREQADHDAYNIWQQIVPATMMCRAATNHFWISATNSMARCSSWPSFIVAPDGSLVDQLPEHTDAVLISRVDQDQEYWDASAPWRDRSVNGQLHSGTAVDHPRSTDRTCL